ncbi:MAG: replication-associated recombination protein A [Thermodesulfobacteriota bacterium]
MPPNKENSLSEKKPLAERIRPDVIDAFTGQSHIKSRMRAMLQGKTVQSTLFFGPPGCGKSTLSLLLAKSAGLKYARYSAPEIGIAALRKKISDLDILILDELHRYSKAQQDFFLPLLEKGDLILLATSTENPSFSVTKQLLSRMTVLRLRALNQAEMVEIAKKGATALHVQLPEESLELLASVSGGDARTLLNLVDYAAGLDQEKWIPDKLKAELPEMVIRGDRDGDQHYELASALIKSVRGSDPDAALYYLACLLESGEDPRFICRRLILSASEDIGLADPQALSMAVSCQQAVDMVGMPEGFIPLAQTAVYLSIAPKSNTSYAGYLAAQKEIRMNGPRPVPLHLRNASTNLQKEWGYGQGYKYPHSYPGAWVKQEYLPQSLAGRSFYQPGDQGREAVLLSWLRKKDKKFKE